MHTSPSSGLPPPGQRVVELATQCLTEIDEVTRHWLESVRPVRAAYSALVPERDFAETAQQAFELLLRTIGRLPVPEALTRISEDIGERRAHQGVPLDSLLEAARLDFRVVWAALLERADERDKVLLAGSAYHVWEAVERHVTGIMTAYQRTVLEMGRREEDERRSWFTRLLETGGHNATVVRDSSLALGLSARGRFLCAVGGAATGAGLRNAATELRSAGVPVQVQGIASDVVLTVQLSARTTAESVLAHFPRTPCGVAPVADGLAAVPHAVVLATATARVLPPHAAAPRQLRESWLDVLVSRSEDFGQDLADDVLGGLHSPAVPPSETERLLETARTHLAGSGSIADTADALYCHRNTVQHRFNRFLALTGRDLRRPDDMALVSLALRAHGRYE